jgi:hypothetical protein
MCWWNSNGIDHGLYRWGRSSIISMVFEYDSCNYRRFINYGSDINNLFATYFKYPW